MPQTQVAVAVDQAFGHAADPSSSVVSTVAVPGFLVLAAIEPVVAYFYLRSLHRDVQSA